MILKRYAIRVYLFFKALYANLDSGLANKRDEHSAIINDKDPDILIFNEILPKQNRAKKRLSPKSFIIYGYEYIIRSSTVGKGVILYFKSCLKVQSVDMLNNFNFDESIWIHIKLKGCDNLLVGNIYRSPSSLRENNVNIVGDFNYWRQSNDSVDHSSSPFIETIKDLFLYQHVDMDTRHRVGQSSSRLDFYKRTWHDFRSRLYAACWC